jgi:hypothetical protein
MSEPLPSLQTCRQNQLTYPCRENPIHRSPFLNPHPCPHLVTGDPAVEHPCTAVPEPCPARESEPLRIARTRAERCVRCSTERIVCYVRMYTPYGYQPRYLSQRNSSQVLAAGPDKKCNASAHEQAGSLGADLTMSMRPSDGQPGTIPTAPQLLRADDVRKLGLLSTGVGAGTGAPAGRSPPKTRSSNNPTPRANVRSGGDRQGPIIAALLHPRPENRTTSARDEIAGRHGVAPAAGSLTPCWGANAAQSALGSHRAPLLVVLPRASTLGRNETRFPSSNAWRLAERSSSPHTRANARHQGR